jgi:FkbM family methyltransferase
MRIANQLLSNAIISWIRSENHPMKVRLVRYVHKLLGNPLIIAPYINGTKILVDPTDFIGSKIIILGSWELEVYEIISAKLSHASTFVDIGSHYGSFSVPIAKQVSRVIALDANPLMTEILTTCLKINNVDNVIVESCALSDSVGTLDFFVSCDVNTGTSSLVDGWALGRVERIRVKSTTLDEIVDRLGLDWIDCLKIDVEGSAERVLLGAPKALQRTRRVVIEVSTDQKQISRMLKDAGFRVSMPSLALEVGHVEKTLVADR